MKRLRKTGHCNGLEEIETSRKLFYILHRSRFIEEKIRLIQNGDIHVDVYAEVYRVKLLALLNELVLF